MTTSFTSVLVVDPDSDALRELRINLSAHDYRVLTATDATDAVDKKALRVQAQPAPNRGRPR